MAVATALSSLYKDGEFVTNALLISTYFPCSFFFFFFHGKSSVFLMERLVGGEMIEVEKR